MEDREAEGERTQKSARCIQQEILSNLHNVVGGGGTIPEMAAKDLILQVMITTKADSFISLFRYAHHYHIPELKIFSYLFAGIMPHLDWVQAARGSHKVPGSRFLLHLCQLCWNKYSAPHQLPGSYVW